MKRILLVLAFFAPLTMRAQISQQDKNLAPAVPVSPNAATLGKFIDAPVGLSNGIPEINLPLYNIDYSGLKVPISINYHAGGVKVEDLASNVGLGWVLNCGGAISRTVRGLQDDLSNGYLAKAPAILPAFEGLPASEKQTLLTQINNNQLDLEPDLFTYSFPGGSGKFMFDLQGKILPLTTTKARFDYTLAPSGGMATGITGFTITNTDGNIYQFNKGEVNRVENIANVFTRSPAAVVRTSWYLTRIISPVYGEINFEYENSTYSFKMSDGESRLQYLFSSPQGYGSSRNNKFETSNDFIGAKLKRISFGRGEVLFRFGAPRCDLPGDSTLSGVQIRYDGVLRKEIKLWQSYFGSQDCQPDYTNNKRLKLDSVQFFGADNSLPPLTYQYEYDRPGQLPDRFSNAQDHWGYFNGKTTNLNLIPAFFYTFNGNAVFYDGANRNISEDHTKIGSLKKTVFPTGGYTEYAYEINRAANPELALEEEVRNVSISYNGSSQLFRDFKVFNQYYTAPDNVLVQRGYVGCTIAGVLCSPLSRDCADISIISIDDPLFVPVVPVHGKSYWLPNGNYRLIVRNIQHSSFQGFNIALNIQNGINSLNRPAPGLRVREIRQFDGVSANAVLVKSFIYTDENDVSKSSGWLVNQPVYCHNYSEIIRTTSQTQGGDFTVMYRANYIVRSASSNQPLGTNAGAYVGYGHVSTLDGGGKTSYRFTTAVDFPDVLSNAFPFPPAVSNERSRGMPLGQIQYKALSTGQHVRQSEEISSYFLPAATSVPTPFTRQTSGLKSGILLLDRSGSNDIPSYSFATSLYKQVSDFNYPVKTTTRQYEDNGLSEKVAHIVLNPGTLRPATLTTTDSKGAVMTEATRYVADFLPLASGGSGEALQGLNLLAGKNMIDAVVEKYISKKQNSTAPANYLHGVYKTYFPGQAVAKTVSMYNSAVPMANYQTVSVYNGNLVADQKYGLESTILTIDERGNATSMVDLSGVTKVVLWGYDRQLPVATITNASYAQAAALISQSLLDAPPGDAALRAELNKLRSGLPAGAQVTTYTYAPLIGLTSQTDPNGRVSYSEYDSFGRLQRIRDHDGNVLKVMDYQFQKAITQ